MTAVYYEGPGRFTVGESEVLSPGAGEVRLDVAFCGVCGTDVHIARGHMDHRVRVPQVIGHEMSGTVAELGPGVDGYDVGDPVVVRPLDTRAETAADKGFSHICRGLKFLGIDTPGAFQSSWTVPAFTLHRLPPTVDLRLAALVEPLAVACHDVRRGEVVADESVVVIGGGPIGLLVGLVASGGRGRGDAERGQLLPPRSSPRRSGSTSSTRPQRTPRRPSSSERVAPERTSSSRSPVRPRGPTS